MKYRDVIRNLIGKVKRLVGKGGTEIQPRDILGKLISELEKRKKLGIDENPFVPNVFAVYLSPVDYEELSPLLTGIREQLKSKIMERVKKRGYKLLSSTVSIDIREDGTIGKNQVVVESSFLKEKVTGPAPMEDNRVISLGSVPPRGQERQEITPTQDHTPAPERKVIETRLIEDKKTKLIDTSKVKLEIVDGEEKGEVIALKEGEYTFGRGREAAILIKDQDETISRVHFKITVREGHVSIRDLDSTNGTRVNEIAIEEAELKKGDTISAGKITLKVA